MKFRYRHVLFCLLLASAFAWAQDEISALHDSSQGDPSDPLTRQASFLLAERLLRERGPQDPETLEALRRTTLLYPDDPRTPPLLAPLADARLREGRGREAHEIYLRLIDELKAGEPEVRVAAAYNALQLGQHEAAWRWIERIALQELPPPVRSNGSVVRLRAAFERGLLSHALAALTDLEDQDPERIRIEPLALWAAAQIDEKMGRLGEAAARYEMFANVHPDAEGAAQARLALVRLRIAEGRIERARHAAAFLAELHPGSTEATKARLAVLAAEPDETFLGGTQGFVAAVREAGSIEAAYWAADQIVVRFSAAGFPLEGLETLALLAREGDPGDMTASAARRAIAGGLPGVLALLESRDDAVGVVAAGLLARSVGVVPAQAVQPTLTRARRRLGLGPDRGSLVGQAVRMAREKSAAGDWRAVPGLIVRPLALSPDADRVERLEATLLLAEALWRTERRAEALQRIDAALDAGGLQPRERRRLLVLRADVRFAAGERDAACGDYRDARETAASPWVAEQLERCGESA